MNILLLTSHSIAEFDDLRMLSDLGYDVFSIGAYTDPAHPTDDKRPALDLLAHPDLAALCERQRTAHAGEDTSFVIDWAKGDLAPEIIEWADAIIVHHFPIPWIAGQWQKLRGKRVIWRTCGQSSPGLEMMMRPVARQGLEIVRYSPKEQPFFEYSGAFAGADALIRFGKYPSDYGPWVGDDPVIGNVSQWEGDGDPLGRRVPLNLAFWREATEGLPVRPAGPGSQALTGGLGPLPYPAMLEYLRHIRAYLYTGTTPAPYTLGLIEAMLSGVPTVSIGPRAWGIPDLFEGHEIVGSLWGRLLGQAREITGPVDSPATAHKFCQYLLSDIGLATIASSAVRQRAIDLFGMDTIGPQWRAFLGYPGRSVFSTERESVTA